MNPIKLTTLSHGGGCGCKIAPAVLSELLAGMATAGLVPEALLVGTESSDDAAVYKLNDEQAIVATTDFFMPIVDDPYDFGRIAATNALADIYAMGGRPLFALAILGMPIDKLPVEVIRRILEGGESVCKAAGIPVAGGHSIDAPEPIYGLVGIGVVHPAPGQAQRSGQAGDVLILGKPLGIGVFADAMKKGQLSPEGLCANAVLHYPTKYARNAFGGLVRCPCHDRRHRFWPAGTFAGNVPWLKTCGGYPIFQPAYSPSGGNNWPNKGLGLGHRHATGTVLLKRSYCPITCPTGSARCCATRRPAEDCLVACDENIADEVLSVFRNGGFASAALIGRLVVGTPPDQGARLKKSVLLDGFCVSGARASWDRRPSELASILLQTRGERGDARSLRRSTKRRSKGINSTS